MLDTCQLPTPSPTCALPRSTTTCSSTSSASRPRSTRSADASSSTVARSRSRKARGRARSSSSSSRRMTMRRPGTRRRPTKRSSPCARGTSRARRSSSDGVGRRLRPGEHRGRPPCRDGEAVALRRWRSSTSSAPPMRRRTCWRPATGSCSTRSTTASAPTTGSTPSAATTSSPPTARSSSPTLRSCRGHSTSAGGSCRPATSRPWRPIAARRGEGLGSEVMARVGEVVRAEFEIGALSTGVHHFYERLGWLGGRDPRSSGVVNGSSARPTRTTVLMVLSPTSTSTSPPRSPARNVPGDDW